MFIIVWKQLITEVNSTEALKSYSHLFYACIKGDTDHAQSATNVFVYFVDVLIFCNCVCQDRILLTDIQH